MQSKGGYEYTCALSEVAPEGIDLKKESNNEENKEKTDQPNGPTATEEQTETKEEDTSKPNRTEEEEGNQL